MQILTIEVNSDNGVQALHNLEEKHLIRIVDNNTNNSPALPGAELSIQQFQNWILEAEAAPTMSLHEAKLQWANKRKRLQQLEK